jgi:hypothetical protein
MRERDLRSRSGTDVMACVTGLNHPLAVAYENEVVIHTSHAGVVVSESSETVRHGLDFNSRAKRLASDEIS